MGALPGSSEGACQRLVSGEGGPRGSRGGSGGWGGECKQGWKKRSEPMSPPGPIPPPWTQWTLITGECEAKGDAKGKWLFKWYL